MPCLPAQERSRYDELIGARRSRAEDPHEGIRQSREQHRGTTAPADEAKLGTARGGDVLGDPEGTRAQPLDMDDMIRRGVDGDHRGVRLQRTHHRACHAASRKRGDPCQDGAVRRRADGGVVDRFRISGQELACRSPGRPGMQEKGVDVVHGRAVRAHEAQDRSHRIRICKGRVRRAARVEHGDAPCPLAALIERDPHGNGGLHHAHRKEGRIAANQERGRTCGLQLASRGRGERLEAEP